MDILIKECSTQSEQDFVVKNYDAKIEIKGECVDELTYTENNSLSLVKLEPLENDNDNSPIKNNSFILPSTDLETDLPEKQISKNIVKQELEFEYFSNEEHCSDLIQDTKIETAEVHLKNETDNIEARVKKETYQDDGSKNRNLSDKLDKRDILHKSKKCDFISHHLHNSKVLDGVTYTVHSCNVGENMGKNQNKDFERSNFKTHTQTYKSAKDDEPPYKYNICDFETIHKPNLENHLQVHSRKYPCQICGKKFSSNYKLDRHIVSRHHSENKIIMDTAAVVSKINKCDICEYKTLSVHYLMHHNMEEHKSTTSKQKYTCKILCDYETTRKKSNLKKHAKTTRNVGKRDFFCQLCDRSFTTRLGYSCHVLNKHGDNKEMMDMFYKIYKCDMCEYDTPSECHFKRHLRKHESVKTNNDQTKSVKTSVEPDQTYQCDMCGYKTTLKNYLIKHIQIHAIERRFACHVCDKKYVTKNHLDRHIVSMHSENKEMMDSTTCKIYMCEMCGYRSANSNFKTHLQLHKSVKTERIYQCDQCSYNTIIKCYLRKHMKVHSITERRFLCHVCGKKFNSNYLIRRHIEYEHSEKKKKMDSAIKIYKCNWCEYKTVSVGRFKRHLPKHKRIKPEQKYQCDICGYETIIKRYLRKHIQAHAGDRRFLCRICDKKFSAKRTLDCHIVSTHSENKKMMDVVTYKIYQCDMCEYKTTVSYRFKRHLKTHKRVKIKQI